MKNSILAMVLVAVASMAHAESIPVNGGQVIVKEKKATFKPNKGASVNIPVDEDTMYFGVQSKTKDSHQDVILFSQSSGGTACPATYFFYRIKSNGETQRTPTFGTCSDLVKVKQTPKGIVVTMPNVGSKGKSEYVYDYEKLTENGKVLK